MHRLDTAEGPLPVAKYGALAERKAIMLRTLREAGMPARTVIACEPDLLVMEHIESTGSLALAWDDLARVFGMLHGITASTDGRAEDYAFGKVAIANTPAPDWPRFWSGRQLLCRVPHLPATLVRRA